MWQGAVVSIHIAAAARGPLVSVTEVRAVTGKGLEGDRYFSQSGTHSNEPGLGRDFTVGEVTLRGIRLCEPCSHLERLSRKGV